MDLTSETNCKIHIDIVKQILRSKKLVILSDNSIIFDALTDNLVKYLSEFCQNNLNEIITNKQKHQFEITIGNKSILIENILMHNQSLINMSKIDILFIDGPFDSNLIQLFRINILANLTKNNILEREIIFIKPYALHDLITMIVKNYHDETIFCCINDDWIYCENSAHLKSNEQIITLTDKENILFKTLLEKDQFSCEKDYLRSKVWNYHQDSESSTVATHLYKLKAKLPAGLLEIKNANCQLNIESLE